MYVYVAPEHRDDPAFYNPETWQEKEIIWVKDSYNNLWERAYFHHYDRPYIYATLLDEYSEKTWLSHYCDWRYVTRENMEGREDFVED